MPRYTLCWTVIRFQDIFYYIMWTILYYLFSFFWLYFALYRQDATVEKDLEVQSVYSVQEWDSVINAPSPHVMVMTPDNNQSGIKLAWKSNTSAFQRWCLHGRDRPQRLIREFPGVLWSLQPGKTMRNRLRPGTGQHLSQAWAEKSSRLKPHPAPRPALEDQRLQHQAVNGIAHARRTERRVLCKGDSLQQVGNLRQEVGRTKGQEDSQGRQSAVSERPPSAGITTFAFEGTPGDRKDAPWRAAPAGLPGGTGVFLHGWCGYEGQEGSRWK